MNNFYTIGIIDDDQAYVRQFTQYFATTTFKCVFSAYSLSDVLCFPDKLPADIDVLFLDIMMPGISGVDGLYQLKALLPNTEIVMLTAVEEQDKLLKSLCLGASGYLLKDTSYNEIEQYITIVKNGGAAISPKMARHIIAYFGPKTRPDESLLTEKNLQVLHLLAEGWNYKTIADRMSISVDGVRYHIKEVYRALGVQSVAQAVRKYVDGDLPKR
jgi:DNA-binding NarL/FixJ family response regulator